jgi:hypothetical protein
MRKSHILLLAAVFAFVFSSCRRDREPEPLEQEVITTMTLRFVNTADATDTPTFTFRDPDGDGGSAPTTFDTIRLRPDATYHLMIELLDESGSPAENITEEVEEEGHEHQFFFSTQPTGLATVTYADADKDGNPIGIHSRVSTNAQPTTDNNGKFRIMLKHALSKTAAGVKNGDMTNVGGDTDVDISFPFVLE